MHVLQFGVIMFPFNTTCLNNGAILLLVMVVTISMDSLITVTQTLCYINVWLQESHILCIFNSYPAMRLLARYCYSALCTRARYLLIASFMLASHRYSALCTLASICNNSHCSCPLHRAECFCSAIESTIACIRLSALDYASLYTTVRLDFLE